MAKEEAQAALQALPATALPAIEIGLVDSPYESSTVSKADQSRLIAAHDDPGAPAGVALIPGAIELLGR
jgi:hypothetical protein